MVVYGSPHIDIAPWMDWKSSITYTPTRQNDSTQLGMGQLQCVAGAAGNHIEWDVPLTAGTWTLTLIYKKNTNVGILTPSVDGTDLSTVDMYGAGAVNTVAQWTGISIATDGIKELKFRTDTKNASSSNYHFLPQWITLVRTGA